MAHWVAMRYGISEWKARRWVEASQRLRNLPRISAALAAAAIGIDKVGELTRFATPQTEYRLLRCAQSLSSEAIRRRADIETRRSLADAEDVERSRRVAWWYFDEGRRFGLEAELPAAQGAIVARAIKRLAGQVPSMPGEAGEFFIDQRRADALVLRASRASAPTADPDPGMVVVHAKVEALVTGQGACEIEGGGVIHAETARRLLCSGRLQTLIEEDEGNPVRLGRSSREPSPAMMRVLRNRDGECRFPGCGARRFTNAHHVRWWSGGGPTDLDNLVLVCGYHHRLVHEYGWRLRREPDGVVSWFRPGGARYRAGPAPPRVATSP